MLINYWGNLQRTNQIHYMKKYLLLLLSLLSLQSFAAENQVVQEVAVVESVVEEPAYNPQYRDVPPTFLGIPIDGPKSEFVAKLKQKGFVDSEYGYLKGMFNGKDVELYVYAGSNDVVYCVRVFYSEVHSDYAFINDYNDLYNQFLQLPKYWNVDGGLLTKSALDAIKNNPKNVQDKGVISYNIAYFAYAGGHGQVSIGLKFFSEREYFKYREDDCYIMYIDYANADSLYSKPSDL